MAFLLSIRGRASETFAQTFSLLLSVRKLYRKWQQKNNSTANESTEILKNKMLQSRENLHFDDIFP